MIETVQSRPRLTWAKLFVAALMASGTPLLDGSFQAANAQDQAPSLDTYLCYDVKRSSKFNEIENVHLQDLFNNLDYDVEDTRELCTPAAGPQRNCVDARTHLQRYKIDEEGEESLPQGVTVMNEFGTIVLDTKSGDKLMVPAAKDLKNQPSAPDPQSHSVDHYHCYDVELADGQKFPKNLQIVLEDQFTNPVKTFNIIRPEHVCPVVNKNNEGVHRPFTGLLCYKIELAKKQPKHSKVKKIRVTDQFGPLTLDTKAENEVCVPSEIFGSCIFDSGPCDVIPCCSGSCFSGSICTPDQP